MDDFEYTDTWERTDTVIMERPKPADVDEQPPVDEDCAAADAAYLT